jgi:phosphatidylserine/phosphatidylglycerophosphate/cardiolipin synthase-like enzyme
VKIIISSLIIILSSISVFSLNTNSNFKIPTIVQNYPSDHLMNMDGAKPAYEAIGELILSAKKNIDIEVFYVDNKPESKLDKFIIKPLIKQAKNGILVRIMVDANMAKTYHSTLDKLSTILNIKVVKNSYFDNVYDGIVHAKIIIADDKTFYLGSHNFDWITFELNHELGVIYENRNLAETMKEVFEFDWKNANSNKKVKGQIEPANHTGNQYEISISPPDIGGIKSDQQQLIDLMNNAKSEICMQAMQVIGADTYATPIKIWTKFNNAILNAANRGVKIRIMMSNWEFTRSYLNASNKFLQYLIISDKNGNIKVRYSSFPIHDPCVPYSEVDHAKYMVVDGESAWISTANLTESYFTGCRNYSFTAKNDKLLGKQMLNIFNTMWNSKFITVYREPVTKVTDNTCSLGKK